MVASRQAFRFARRAANHLGQHSGVANSSVAGGMFSQNCFMSTSVGRRMPGMPVMSMMTEIEDEAAEALERLCAAQPSLMSVLQMELSCLRCAPQTVVISEVQEPLL
eukprot:TRINITY_DN303_c0_g1_i1.p2 TRINITY_DN303_c0_g1~~TRINITY_DN303_c0_g1_i1.p2  ORF type:complete len:107 (+),score=26.41 TRINITY_DN303_c0_g1_i1:64-384(+)